MLSKKIIILFTIFALITISVTPQINATQEKTLGIFDNIRVLDFNTTLSLSVNEEDIPQNPLDIGIDYKVPISISFKYENPQFYPAFLTGTKVGKWILFRNTSKDMSVNLSLDITSPDWCKVNLTDEVIPIDLSTDEKTATSTINFKIKEGTNAFEEDNIEVNAKFTPQQGWGLLESDDSTSFKIMSEYKGSIEIEHKYQENDTVIDTKPGREFQVPVNITNTGNGETKVMISLNDEIEEFNISIAPESETIPAGETKQTMITFNISGKEESYRKNLTFTVSSESTTDIELDQEYTKGETESFTIKINVVKHEEENNHYGNLLIILGILILILLIVGLVIKFLKKR